VIFTVTLLPALRRAILPFHCILGFYSYFLIVNIVFYLLYLLYILFPFPLFHFPYIHVLSYLHSTDCISCLFPHTSLSFLPLAWLRYPVSYCLPYSTYPRSSPNPLHYWYGQDSTFSNLFLYLS
jgi:hypothetical protein